MSGFTSLVALPREISFQRGPFLPPPPRVSDEETKLYYAGLPSKPVLVARTGTTPYEAPTGPEAYSKLKELRIVGDHEITEIWEDDLAFKSSGNVILWIGVKPDSLSYEVGIDVALQCKGLLVDRGINDVDVEIRQSEVIRSAGPQLFQPTFDINPTVDVREPFTATVGIPICAQSTPWAEGTGGFFLDEGKRLLLATARHVVFPQTDNNLFEHKSESQRRHNVLVLSEASFQQHLLSIQDQIKAQDINIRYQMKRIEKVVVREDDGAVMEHEDAQSVLKKVEAKPHFGPFFSPSIAVGTGTEQYTQDVAVIDIDASKIDPSSFAGNVIDLGTKFPPDVLTAMMYPNPRNSHNFDYPGDRLLSLRGTITDDEMRKPTMYDQKNDRCIMVIKSGAFSAKGDSGSVVVDGAGRIGGIPTGGGGTTDSSDVTYATPIGFVLKTIHGNKPLAKAYPKSGPSA
ncbi:hypothetical protein EWM64_g10885 [Hericium alpestre]|uniref:Peptidase S1 domain-containing protein n=1 Tax=Hericium alpestre TaxID=135208 RepID=A0A4Y9ZGG8_9AGAM|nr:hypothetical protein EWM64_g10885 [Hericium alpestre]